MTKLDPHLLNRSKDLWGINEELQFVRRVANYIYYAPVSKLYFRLTESWHRDLKQINSELDWMFFLKSKGLHFAHPIKSKEDNYCERLSVGKEEYIICVFNEAQGKRIQDRNEFTDELLVNWGELVGKMHSTTKSYLPKGAVKRHEWNEEEYHQNIVELIRPEHGKIFDEFQRLEEVFKGLPKDKESYGLIHADLHTGNFHVNDRGQITPFDFDDSIYSWFIYDIVVFLWSIESFNLDWTYCFKLIMKGYSKYNNLNSFWFTQISNFYNYRVILIHYYCMKSLNDPKLDEISKKWMKKRVKESRDFFDMDKQSPFETLRDFK